MDGWLRQSIWFSCSSQIAMCDLVTATRRTGVGVDDVVGVEVAMMLIQMVDDGRLKKGHDDGGGRVRVSQVFDYLIRLPVPWLCAILRTSAQQ